MSRALLRSLAALALALCAAAPARAIMPTNEARDTGRRFGRVSRVLALPTVSDSLKLKAVQGFNSRHGSGAGRLGAASIGTGGIQPADIHSAAVSFLSETKSTLGIDPQQLEMLKTTTGYGGHRHVLYRQVYKGLPVDFSSVKVHFDGAGKVIDVNSNFRRDMALDVNPSVAASVASYDVKKDLGEDTRTNGQLVVVLDPQDGQPRLAWKIKAEKGGRWVYYVDAHSGELILRYDERSYAAGPCGAGDAQGTVRAQMYAYDQEHPDPVTHFLSVLPVPHQWVYLQNSNTVTETDFNGQYCFPGQHGKVFTFLQGPYVRVGNFRGQGAFYSSGTWNSLATPLSSPHPYPNDASDTQSFDVSSLNPSVVAVAPVFSDFAVGTVANAGTGEAADITDDDQVAVLDGAGNPVAFYVGTRPSFTAAAVPGSKYSLLLRSNDGGQANGYDIVTSNGLVLYQPTVNGVGAPDASLVNGPGGSSVGSFDWVSTGTTLGLRAEFALFYHLNQMHDYFVGGVDKSSAAYLTPVSAMAVLGPNIVNAFYDPEYDDFAFGDNADQAPSDIFTDDATVPHHEYTHYVVQKIWNIQNFGEAGAISEANADYFSATSLGYQCTLDGTQGGSCDPAHRLPLGTANSSSIGKAVDESLGNVGPLRELDGTKGQSLALGSVGGGCPPSNASCTVQAWIGEIHADSIFVSQSLWDMRKALIGSSLGAVAGQKCADELQFQALLFFPESFSELVNAITHVDALGLAPDCGGSSRVAILTGGTSPAGFFAKHGLPNAAGGADPYDTVSSHNDGFETAVDISTLGAVSATIYPASDIDFYTFAAGPGQMTLELDLPAEGAYYSGYMITLYDHTHAVVAQQTANYNGINTDFGLCTQLDCTTTDSKIVLNYMNPTGGQMFVEISGGPTDQGGSNSGVINTTPYVLKPTFQRPYALSSGIISAQLDHDLLDFTIQVTTWTGMQDYRFLYGQLRDQSQAVLQDTDAPAQTAGTKYLTWISSNNALGQITGTVQLANGFNARFPAVGTVYLEVFAYNVTGSTVSLGLSNPINLTTNSSDVHAWNNVFNPRNGQKSTVRYDLQAPGHLTMKLYTLNGLLVETLFDGDAPAGKGSVDWYGNNANGVTVASGIYLLHIQGPGISKTQKIAVIK